MGELPITEAKGVHLQSEKQKAEKEKKNLKGLF